MSDNDRETTLDDLCRRALTSRTELDLYVAYERGEIAETDPDYSRAKEIHARYL